MSLRISATTVESFHLYLTEDWMTEARFLAQLKDRVATPQMRRGIAWENILRNPSRYARNGVFVDDGFEFSEEMVRQGVSRIPHGVIWQPKSVKDYDVDGEIVRISSKADCLKGRIGIEIKTTENYDLSKYRNSRQWRFYLDVFGSDSMRYIVFEMRESKRDGGIYLAGIHEWDEFPYPGMEGELVEDLRALVRFIHLRGLEEYFPPKEEEALL